MAVGAAVATKSSVGIAETSGAATGANVIMDIAVTSGFLS
jgi:hypothetical protein